MRITSSRKRVTFGMAGDAREKHSVKKKEQVAEGKGEGVAPAGTKDSSVSNKPREIKKERT